eukprot:CAMPEP_0115022958 /NCGR_PEP_ID=MMETSP0216-20121206/31988_1 /TAXON_ID=223996 /ORGANISM="Protocruzia adherens, Strain Boccale" /LENGTH=123 /DNA_ID=CAMNT_0002395997 /DNA_START=19 /DNA_END=387 /DNA_ORIENTATION=-
MDTLKTNLSALLQDDTFWNYLNIHLKLPHHHSISPLTTVTSQDHQDIIQLGHSRYPGNAIDTTVLLNKQDSAVKLTNRISNNLSHSVIMTYRVYDQRLGYHRIVAIGFAGDLVSQRFWCVGDN